MRSLFRTAAVAAIAASVTLLASESSAHQSKKEPSGSISGRVMLGDKPVPRVVVILTPSNPVAFNQQTTPPARATTDEDGNYRLTRVPAGSYNIAPFTPAFVVPAETSFAQPGKTVTLADGEEVDGIDFSLSRGGVITGRVTDADGRPIIGQNVRVTRIDERGQRLPTSSFSPFAFSTDDRGVYRIYGLPPGRYKVYIGDPPNSGIVRFGYQGGAYAQTFHPDVSDESQAEVIEVTAGGEAAGVNIKVGRPTKNFVATGRIVDADSGKPLANLQYGHGGLDSRDQTRLGAFGWTGNRSNENGEFRIDGLSPGRYATFVVANEQLDFYSEPTVFEITDSDISGLEIKVRRGSSISGLAVIEGSDDPDVLANISKLELRAYVQTEGLSAPTMGSIRINADGSFRITGLRAGKVGIILSNYPPLTKGFSLLRVERDGIKQTPGIDVGAGQNVSGVRVVIGYGTGVIRGQLQFQNGERTPDMRFRVSTRRLDETSPMPVWSEVDARGRFSVEGLMAGEYEIVVNPMSVSSSAPGAPIAVRTPPKPVAKQNVVVANNSEVEITLVVDLGAKEKQPEK